MSEPRRKESARASLGRVVRVYGSIFEMSWAAARGRAVALFSIMFLLGLSGAVNAWVVGSVVDAVGAGRGHSSARALVFGALFLAIAAGATLLQDLNALLQVDMADRISHEVDLRLMAISSGAPGLDHLERSAFADRMKQVRERQWIPAQLLQTINSGVYVIIGMVAGAILLGSIHLVLALLPVVMIPSAWIQFRAFRKHWSMFDEAAPDQRLADHHLRLATGQTGAKEIRLFGLRDHLLSEHRRLSDAFVRRMFRARLKQSASSTLGGVLYGTSLTLAIAFLGVEALNGRATAGDIALGIQVTRLMIGHVEMAAELVAGIAELGYMGERYLWLLNYRPALTVRARETALPAPPVIREGITFEDVTFSYPGTEKTVLDRVSLFLPASSTVALVGENGAGKSSIVKLLSRFYDPTQGRILVDGVDLRDIDLEDWRARLSSAFQDFVRFQFVASEVVGVGDLSRIEDTEAVERAVRFAGADRILAKLPEGLRTQLGRQFEDGHDLSEGEWQRFALARGSMRADPAVVVLDEPTASLDARAEHDVFERFAEMARPADGHKPVTLLVSHRFSTVRMADLIVVLHEGNVEEAGSHDSLISAGGRYSELFRMQASRYDD
ncbi:MAG: ABC transporter ATP-binding protein [Actinomycetota bacterium]